MRFWFIATCRCPERRRHHGLPLLTRRCRLLLWTLAGRPRSVRWCPDVDDELVTLLHQHRDEIRRHFDVVVEALRAEMATAEELRAVRAELAALYALLDRRPARVEPDGPGRRPARSQAPRGRFALVSQHRLPQAS